MDPPRGVESIPVVLVLGAMLTAFVVGLGARSLHTVQELRGLQLALEDFNRFVEAARSALAEGSSLVRLESKAKLSGEGRLVELLVNGEVRAAEILPLPIAFGPKRVWEIGAGVYELRLEGNGLELRRI